MALCESGVLNYAGDREGGRLYNSYIYEAVSSSADAGRGLAGNSNPVG